MLLRWLVWLFALVCIASSGAFAAPSALEWRPNTTGERLTVDLGEPLSGPITVASELLVKGAAWKKGDWIDLARVAEVGKGEGALSLRATVVSAGFFVTTWRLQLVAEAGLLGEVSAVDLPGLEHHLLRTDALHRVVLSYDPVSGELSASIVVDPEGQAETLFSGFVTTKPGRGALQGPLVGGVGVAGVSSTAVDSALQIHGLSQTGDYRRQGGLIPLHGAKAVVRSSVVGQWGDVLLRRDPLVFVIVRSPGELRGFYRLEVDDGEEPLFEVPAHQETTEVDLGIGALPPGSYRGRVVYVEYDEDGRDGALPVYREEIAVVDWRVVPPTIAVDFQIHPQLSALDQGRLSQVRGELILEANQPAREVNVRVLTQAGESVLDRRFARVTTGETRVPLSLRISPDVDPHDVELVVEVTGADGMPAVKRAFTPFGISRDVLSTMRVRVEVVSFFGDEPQEAAVQDDSLVRVWTHSPLAIGEIGNLVVHVDFTSPSGKLISTPSRRITLRPDADPFAQTFTTKMTGLKWSEVRASDVRHWFSDLKPAEAGLWSYDVYAINPNARLEHVHEDPNAHVARKYWRWHDGSHLPGRFLIAQGTFEVLPKREGSHAAVETAVSESPDASGASAGGSHQAPPSTVRALRYIDDSTVKLEQVTGDWDKHLHRPTINQTLSRAAVAGTDLGRTFEHEGDLIILFGDTVGPDGFIQSFVAKSSTRDPEAEGGFAFDVYTERHRRNVALRLQPPGISMGGFEVPTGGISLDGKMYILVRTSWNEPYGRSVLLHFDPELLWFRVVREFSPYGGKFVEVEMRRAPGPVPGLPQEKEWVLLWGTGERYRQSPVYLGAISVDEFEKNGATRYFAGLDQDGTPVWSHLEEDAVPVIQGNVGEFSIIRVPELGIWVFMYADRLSWSKDPWGPWSPFISIPIEPVAADAFQYRPASDPYLAGPTIGPEDPYRVGGPYGHYMVERFTRVHGDILRLYYLISTWNPYEVVLMRSDFRIVWD